MAAIELSEPRTEQEFEDYYRLRWERLRKDHGESLGSEREHPAEASSNHVVAKLDGRVVGAVCWAIGMHRDEATGERHIYVRSRQLAVDPKVDGRGVGIVLMRHVERSAKAIGASQLVGNVREHNVPYFESLGWVVQGPGETMFGIEHIAMTRPLS